MFGPDEYPLSRAPTQVGLALRVEHLRFGREDFDRVDIHAESRRSRDDLICARLFWDLTPLDNGAFGKVKLWLQGTSYYIATQGWDAWHMVDAAFREAVPNGASARECFYRCGYGMTCDNYSIGCENTFDPQTQIIQRFLQSKWAKLKDIYRYSTLCFAGQK